MNLRKQTFCWGGIPHQNDPIDTLRRCFILVCLGVQIPSQQVFGCLGSGQLLSGSVFFFCLLF